MQYKNYSLGFKLFRKGVVEVARRGLPAFIVSTGLWIRDHLVEVGEDYPLAMYKLFKFQKKQRGVSCGSYQNFRQYIWWLRKLGLIEFVRSEPSANPVLESRRYYRVVAGTEDNLAWRNPRRTLYPESWKKHH